MLDGFGRCAEGKIFRLPHQSVPERGVAAGDEKRSAGDVLEAVKDEEAILRLALGFERTAPPNVDGADAAFQQRRADHQETMTLQRIFLGTHEGGDAGAGEGESALEAFREFRRAAARGVVDEPVFPVHAWISGPAAESFPEKFVLDAG